MWPLLEVFNVFIPTYSLLLALGVLAGLFILFIAARRKRVALDFLADHFFILFVVTLITARLSEMMLRGYGILNFPFFWQDSGFDFYGGAIGFFVTLIYICRRRGESFLLWLDLTMLTVTVVLIFHHLGTLATGTAYGQPTSLPWGIVFINPDAAVLTTLPIHPTQVYAALSAFLIFVMGALLFKRTRETGKTGAFLLLLLSISVFLIDFLRDDSAPTFGLLRASQYFALLFIVSSGVVVAHLKHIQHKQRTHELSLHNHKS